MANDKAPWDKPNPRKKAGKASKHLSSKKKTKAKSIAKAHGRSRPSLVDNMNAAKGAKSSRKKRTAKSSTKTKTASKKAAKKATVKTVAKRASTAKKAAPKKAATKKRTASKRASPKARDARGARTKDPAGGLTASGRAEFARTQGSHLKAGVTKPESEMSPDEMRRKGSWAVRFYGRKSLPPLVDGKGEPTRLALTAHAWGEAVPKTEAEARDIAERGRKLLARYKAETKA